MNNLILIFLFGLGMLLSATATGVMIRVGIVDVPGARSSHQLPTPKCGGIGLWSGFVFILMGLFWTGELETGSTWLLLLSTLGISFLGFVDDLKPLSFKIRLCVQIIASMAFCAQWGGFPTLTLPGLEVIHLSWFGLILAVFWLTGFTNAFNFMDGINGISASTAIVSGLFLTVIFLHLQQPPFALLTLALMASAVGFLPWNFPKARIFLGDVGSQGLGFLLAALGLIAVATSAERFSLLSLLLLFLPFGFDTTFTLIRRSWAQENVFQAHRTHLYQLLNQLGWSHAHVTRLYALMSCVTGLLAWLSLRLPPAQHVYLLAGALVVFGVYGAIVIKQSKKQGLLA